MATQSNFTQDDMSVQGDVDSTATDARPGSLTKLSQTLKFLRSLNSLKEDDLMVYNREVADRIATNEKLKEWLQVLFDSCMKNQTSKGMERYDSYISSCLKKIFQLQFLGIPASWKDTISELTLEYVTKITRECIASQELDNSEVLNCTHRRLNVLLLGTAKIPDLKLSLFSLQILKTILNIVLPEDRVIDVPYFDQLHESITFYFAAKTTINVWIQRREFVEHERTKMAELLKEMARDVEESVFYIHEVLPLVQIEVLQILLYLRKLIETVAMS